MQQHDLATIGLRNEIKSLIQNARKGFNFGMSEHIDILVELKCPSWFILFSSPYYGHKGMTNHDFLREECLIDKLFIRINGIDFDGIHSVHNPLISKLLEKTQLEIIANQELDFHWELGTVQIKVFLVK